jgi:D-Tyr-tRNAtyr deacylase
MKAVVQRVIDAAVTVNGVLKGGIASGLLVYLGVARDDTPRDADWLVEKIPHLRIFDDSEGKMNLSLLDIVNQKFISKDITQRHQDTKFQAYFANSASSFVPPCLCEMHMIDTAIVNHKNNEVNIIPNILTQRRQGAKEEKEDKKFTNPLKNSAPLRLCVRSSRDNAPIGVLAVSQFTLLGDARKGRRPTWDKAAPPEKARELYQYFIGKMREKAPCESGEFQAHMMVSYTNDGPVTIILDSALQGRT